MSKINKLKQHILVLGSNYEKMATDSDTGLIPGREKDELGIALGAAHNNSKYIAKAKLENINLDKYETAIELTYLFHLTNWIKRQPDFQYIFNPVNSFINHYSLISAIRLSISL